MKDVHTEHCCIKHGCKYCDEDCTVMSGELEQSFMCEECEWEEQDPQCIRIKVLEEALRKAQEDINWMLNSRQFLNGFVFDYIDKALNK